MYFDFEISKGNVFILGCQLLEFLRYILFQIVTSSYTDLQDYTYYFVPAPWLSVKLLRLLQNYPPPGTYHRQWIVLYLI